MQISKISRYWGAGFQNRYRLKIRYLDLVGVAPAVFAVKELRASLTRLWLIDFAGVDEGLETQGATCITDAWINGNRLCRLCFLGLILTSCLFYINEKWSFLRPFSSHEKASKHKPANLPCHTSKKKFNTYIPIFYIHIFFALLYLFHIQKYSRKKRYCHGHLCRHQST